MREDLTGRRFGLWVVLFYRGYCTKQGKARWECRCRCGKESTVTASALKLGKSFSCASCSRRKDVRELRRAAQPQPKQRALPFHKAIAKATPHPAAEVNSLIPLGGYLSSPSLLADTECPTCGAITDGWAGVDQPCRRWCKRVRTVYRSKGLEAFQAAREKAIAKEQAHLGGDTPHPPTPSPAQVGTYTPGAA